MHEMTEMIALWKNFAGTPEVWVTRKSLTPEVFLSLFFFCARGPFHELPERSSKDQKLFHTCICMMIDQNDRYMLEKSKRQLRKSFHLLHGSLSKAHKLENALKADKSSGSP